MKTGMLVILLGALSLLPGAAAEDKKEAAVREFPVAGLRIAPRVDGQATKPTAVTSAEELAKAIPDAESQAVIKKQVDLTREQLLLFHWFGSGADKLALGPADGKKEVVFRLTAGETRDRREHVRLFVLPREATWKVEAKP